MVIGGGIAGVQAALDLADSGIEVFLIERSPSIGGRMAQLDKTFPTNDCSLCILSPKLVETGNHPNINIITNAEVEKVEGEAPHFTVTVRKKPRYVDEGKCTGCGVCMAKCPVKIPDAFNVGLCDTKCIRIPFPQAVPAVAIIDRDHCIYFARGKCRICEKFCEPKAIDFNQKEECINIEVGSIILAAGLSEFNAVLKDEYGYKVYPNVVTSMEFERILSASGPTHGHVLRPSNGREPKKIAFIQCVGSRDTQTGNEYCSAICCMQAAKDAIIITEHLSGVEISVFGMDIRAYGKNFDKFIERAQNEHNTRFVRARVSSVDVDLTNDNLILHYEEDGHMRKESFELLILSVGLKATPQLRLLALRLGLRLDELGFVHTTPFSPVGTSRPGIYVCGSISGPKDIPESVIEACGAAASAGVVLREFPCKKVVVEYPPEVPIDDGDRPRVGVFVCHCGINIAATVNVKEVVDYATTLPYVAHGEAMMFACSQDAQKLINEKIHELKLNRVVVAACTPRTHEPLFQSTLKNSGLNPYLFEFANIREQCSWVHQKESKKATEKAKELVKMAVFKALYLEPLRKTKLTVNKNSLIIGGGLAGMTAALDLAGQGYHVDLVEKEHELGGNLRHVAYTLEGNETRAFLESLMKEVSIHPQITVHRDSVVEEIQGFIGHYKTTIKYSSNSKEYRAFGDTEVTEELKQVEHGVVIVASGAKEYTPTEYFYGQDKRVMSQHELEEKISHGDTDLRNVKSVVMIQCVGSRNDENQYCSRVCCSTAIKNALKLKQLNAHVRIFILYRDVRTYGVKELYYKKAREAGVIFIQYDDDEKPVATKDDKELYVDVKEKIMNKLLRFTPDLLVLSNGIVPNDDNKFLSQALKVPLGTDGFFLEAHVKLRPVDFATDGVFVCGLAHYPKDMGETIAQAKAAASRAITVLSKDEIEAEGKVAYVNETRCNGCGLCVSVCAYSAIELDAEKNVASVNEALCKGCGTCAASCRSSAINIKGFKDEQILAALAAL
ncbi:MAG: CoB--CoM heterodisulfide reductase iron-sulfur subunit A family protein [candidate division WOR-3 bacterium]|nr:MAG: CoB--CoM heterodisulfide reductase iron-sulfur subunit A family protein [candidate division WOR-3 bacterium]